MKLLVRLIKFSPRDFGLLVLSAGLIYCLLPVPLGLAVRAFFNALGPRQSGLNAWTAVAALAAIQVGQVLGEYGLTFPWSGLQQRTHSLLQYNLFAGVLRGYGSHGLPEPPAAAISRFRDEPMKITSGSLDAVCDLIGRGVFALVAAVVMWTISPVATIAAFAPVVASALITDLLGTRAATYGLAARQATGRLSGFIGEIVAAHLAVMTAGATSRAVARVASMGEERRRLSVRDTVYGQALNSINFHLVHVATGIVLLITAGAIRAGTFSVGDFALFVVFLDQLAYLPPEIGRLVTELKQTEKSIDRMHGLVPVVARDEIGAAAPIHVVGPLPPLPPRSQLQTLSVRGLTYRYPGSSRGIVDVSFSLRRGGFTVVTGRIGSGKTTLLYVLLGLLPLDSGSVWWNGDLVEDRAAWFVPPRSALTPQVPRLFSETLRDNVELGRPPGSSGLDAAIRQAVLEGDIETLEHGLDTRVGPRGIKLSGGQVQRSAAARMFVAGAELLVIDDLSSALDAETEAELWKRLFSRRQTTTCLVVSHRPAALRRADQIVVLEDGRVADRGTLDELLTRSPSLLSFPGHTLQRRW